MNNSERITAAERSLTFVLSTVAQSARNIRMLMPGGDVIAQSPEEEALYIEQEAIIDRLFQTFSLINNRDVGRADRRLAKIIADCDARSERLKKEHLDRRIKELECKLSPRPTPIGAGGPEVDSTAERSSSSGTEVIR